MFLINKADNVAVSIPSKTFSELEFKERQHLQEWIDKNPSILGEDLLIIQKEFSGFSDTYERLDLLAIDRNGDLVIIENKLDDSGRDVVWQALKYTSYCASLSTLEIKELYQKYLLTKGLAEDAETNIMNFLNLSDFEEATLNNGDQRIILVSAHFRKEVTSTVLWLTDHGINIKCIKVTPYQNKEDILLDTEQIIPTPDIEAMLIKLNQKKQEKNQAHVAKANLETLRYEFWSKAIPQLQKTADTYHNTSPTKDNWIVGATGYTGIGFHCIITSTSARVELYIGRKNKDENEAIYSYLHSYSQKNGLEKAFDIQLEWKVLEHANASKIMVVLPDIRLDDRNDWDKMIQFMGENLSKMKQMFTDSLKEAVSSQIKN